MIEAAIKVQEAVLNLFSADLQRSLGCSCSCAAVLSGLSIPEPNHIPASHPRLQTLQGLDQLSWGSLCSSALGCSPRPACSPWLLILVPLGVSSSVWISKPSHLCFIHRTQVQRHCLGSASSASAVPFVFNLYLFA